MQILAGTILSEVHFEFSKTKRKISSKNWLTRSTSSVAGVTDTEAAQISMTRPYLY